MIEAGTIGDERSRACRNGSRRPRSQSRSPAQDGLCEKTDTSDCHPCRLRARRATVVRMRGVEWQALNLQTRTEKVAAVVPDRHHRDGRRDDSRYLAKKIVEAAVSSRTGICRTRNEATQGHAPATSIGGQITY
jgi:hypothetical protein